MTETPHTHSARIKGASSFIGRFFLKMHKPPAHSFLTHLIVFYCVNIIKVTRAISRRQITKSGIAETNIYVYLTVIVVDRSLSKKVLGTHFFRLHEKGCLFLIIQYFIEYKYTKFRKSEEQEINIYSPVEPSVIPCTIKR